jgi:hypothetical protein
MSESAGDLPVDELPGGLKNNLKWALANIYRWARPLESAEIQEKLSEWRKKVGVSAAETLDAAVPNRCCVMRIPGVGKRCSTEPSNASDCRILARQFHEDAIGKFYPSPCIGCTSLR